MAQHVGGTQSSLGWAGDGNPLITKRDSHPPKTPYPKTLRQLQSNGSTDS